MITATSSKKETNLVWNELNLGGLVESMQPSFGLAEVDTLAYANRNKVLKKHHNLLNKPSYSALMDRYQSLPHKPKSIQSNKIDILADPIKGKFYKYMTNGDTKGQSFNSDNEPPSPRKSMKRQPQLASPRKPTAKQGGFFLTGEDDNGEDEVVPEQPERKSGRGGLAAALRGRVKEASKYQAPVGKTKSKPSKDKLQKRSLHSGKQKISSKPQPFVKKGWTDNTHVSYKANSKNKDKTKANIGILKKENSAAKERITARLLRGVQRSEVNQDQSEENYDVSQNAPIRRSRVSLGAAQRSKGTEDIRSSNVRRNLQPIHEEDRRRADPSMAARKSSLGAPRNKAGVKSAPTIMNRASRARPSAGQGPVDAEGNAITLAGLQKIQPRMGKNPAEILSPIRQPKNLRLSPSVSPHRYSQNQEEPDGEGTESNARAMMDEMMARIAQQRQYNQQTDPMWIQSHQSPTSKAQQSQHNSPEPTMAQFTPLSNPAALPMAGSGMQPMNLFGIPTSVVPPMMNGYMVGNPAMQMSMPQMMPMGQFSQQMPLYAPGMQGMPSLATMQHQQQPQYQQNQTQQPMSFISQRSSLFPGAGLEQPTIDHFPPQALPQKQQHHDHQHTHDDNDDEHEDQQEYEDDYEQQSPPPQIKSVSPTKRPVEKSAPENLNDSESLIDQIRKALLDTSNESPAEEETGDEPGRVVAGDSPSRGNVGPSVSKEPYHIAPIIEEEGYESSNNSTHRERTESADVMQNSTWRQDDERNARNENGQEEIDGEGNHDDDEEDEEGDGEDMDFAQAMERLQRFQSHSQSKGTTLSAQFEAQTAAGTMYDKAGQTAAFAKHALTLSGNLAKAENHLAKYRELAGMLE